MTILGMLVLLALVIGVYVIVGLEFVTVRTTESANTILPGDHIVVNRLFRGINRGDLVTFKSPADHKLEYLRRIIGLPGETIQIIGKRVYINDVEISERRIQVWDKQADGVLEEGTAEGDGGYAVYVQPDSEAPELRAGETAYKIAVTEPFVIPDRHYFVMGDNRDNSQDSRLFGPVDGSLITGKVLLIYWSQSPAEKEDRVTRWRRIFTRPR